MDTIAPRRRDDAGVRAAPALPRALAVVLIGGLGGVLLHRLDAVAVIAPFLVWLAWAASTRHTLEDADTAPDPVPVHLAPAHTEMVEGEVGSFHLLTPLDGIIAATLEVPSHAVLRPAHGAVVAGRGDLHVEFEPRRWGRFGLGPAHVLLGDASGAWRREFTTGSSTVKVRPPASLLVGGSGVARPIGVAGLQDRKSVV